MGAGRGGASVSDAHGFSEGVGLCLVLVAASPLREPGHLRQGLGWNGEEGDPCSRTKMGAGGLGTGFGNSWGLGWWVGRS